MNDFKRSRIDRRRVLGGLGALAAAPLIHPLAAAAAEEPIVRIRGISHAHIDASNMEKTAEFYAVLFGAKLIGQSKAYWVMNFPTNTPGFVYWMPINLATGKASMDGSGLKPGHYAHMALMVDLPDPQATKRISEVINKRFPFADAKPTGPWNEKGEFEGARSIYMKDPDGLLFQLIRPTDNGFPYEGGSLMAPEKTPSPWVAPKEKPLARIRSVNHMHFDVSDLDKSAAFYHALCGATIRDKSTNGTNYTLLLPTGTPGRASWLSLSKAPQPKPSMDGSGVKPGEYAHAGFGVEMEAGPAGTEKLAAAINKRFPDAKAVPTGPGRPDGSQPGGRSIYLRDPDGLIIQLNRPDDDGWLPKST